ncbi:hypothetical protein C8Q72DRAFT_323254 [Fomitopsis betulina]|nr:hypothetical protein C8Q72DRAFT_323254 [Fomitopsis betulina]
MLLVAFLVGIGHPSVPSCILDVALPTAFSLTTRVIVRFLQLHIHGVSFSPIYYHACMHARLANRHICLYNLNVSIA